MRIAPLVAGLWSVLALPVAAVAQDRPRAGASPRPTAKAESGAKPKRFDVAWHEASLAQVLAVIRDETGVNMVVLWPSLEAVGIRRDHPVTLRLKRVSAGLLLRTVLESASAGLEGDRRLGCTIEDGIVKIGTRKALQDAVAETTRGYDSREMEMEIPRFTDAPVLDLATVIGK